MADLFISRQQAEGDLLAAAAYIAERIKSADGHAEAMNSVIPLYLSRGEVDLAAEMANAVNDPYSRDRLLIQVAEKCADLGDDEYALQLADAIEDHGLGLQCRERVAIILANKGSVESAEAIASELPHPDYVQAGIAVAQAAHGNEGAAAERIASIIFPAAQVGASLQIAAIAIEKGQSAKAVTSLETAAASARDIEHDEERIRSFCDIGNAFIEAKRSDKAVEMFDAARADAELLDNIHRDFFLVNSALGFLYAGSTELADNTLDLVTDKTQMASALLGFARDHWKKDEKDDALDALDEAYQIIKSQRDIETRDSRGTNALLTSIAAQFAGWGKTDLAVEIAHENKDPAEITAGLTQIAQILTLQKNDELARQTINQIVEDADRVFALIQLADTKFTTGENDDAVALLEEAMQLADTVPQMVSRASILMGLATRFNEAGDKEKCRQAALAGLAVVGEIRDEAAQASAIAEMSSLYAEAGFTPGDEEARVLDRLFAKADQ